MPVAVVLALVLAAVASAGKPTAYLGSGGKVQAAVQAAPKAAQPVGQLPFTGLDLATFGAVGIGLIGAGVAVRRLSQKKR